MSDTPNLLLPEIAQSQLTKYATHNEALRLLDAFVPGVALDIANAPPSTPSEGDLVIVGTSGSGDFVSNSSDVAMYVNGTWEFRTPEEGWRFYVEDEDTDYRYLSGVWTEEYIDHAKDVVVFFGGLPGNSEVVHREAFTRSTFFAGDLAGSMFDSGVDSAGSVDFDVTVDATTVATITYNAGTNSAVTVTTAGFTVAVGEVLEITGPATADGSMADISIVLKGIRSGS